MFIPRDVVFCMAITFEPHVYTYILELSPVLET